MWEWVAGSVALMIGTLAVFLRRRDRLALGEAIERVGIRDEQIASLLEQNEKLRSAVESDVERQQSALDQLAARGLSPDGTPID
jgi:hypothetical protein